MKGRGQGSLQRKLSECCSKYVIFNCNILIEGGGGGGRRRKREGRED